ncbi:MAG TPA: hypothetical protein PLN31_20895, partial [Azoarcus taiwanensis]|nr:hypothetical protein [Azoarcus taiwanensis]
MNLYEGEFCYAAQEQGRESVCYLQVEQGADGGYVVTATELAENPGPSVTNSWPGLAAAVCQVVLPGIAPEAIEWVERYTSASYRGGHKKSSSPDAKV